MLHPHDRSRLNGLYPLLRNRTECTGRRIELFRGPIMFHWRNWGLPVGGYSLVDYDWNN
jgi:hypothetical protein